MCIYGIKDIPKMTQIKPEELAEVVAPKARKCVSGIDEIPQMTRISLQGQTGVAAIAVDKPEQPSPVSIGDGMLLGAVFLVGLGLGRFSRHP
jgi:hypothetical protein